LATGALDKRVKALILTDNWQYPVQKEIERKDFEKADIPVCWNFSVSYPTLSEELNFDQQAWFLKTLSQFKKGHMKAHN
jgi:hypothetical protein